MSTLGFFMRRLFAGTIVRTLTNFLAKRFRLSGGVANIVFVVLTEMLARFMRNDAPKSRNSGRTRSGSQNRNRSRPGRR